MEIIIEKPKTRKGLSYVLKSSMLQNAMAENGIDCYLQLQYWTPQRHDPKRPWSLIEAEFWLPNMNVDYHRFFIRAGVVESKDRKRAESLLNGTVIPKLMDWMRENLEVQISSTNRPAAFLAYYHEGEIVYHPNKLPPTPFKPNA